MTGNTFGGGAGIIGRLMAFLAIIDGMSAGQREKIMIDPGTCPGDRSHVVAFKAVF